MSESVLGRQRRALFDRLPSFTLEAVRHRLVRVLARIEWGQIELVDPTHGTTLLGQPSNPGPRVRVLVHDPLMYSYIGLGGSIGAGQSYFLGMWDTNALSDVVRSSLNTCVGSAPRTAATAGKLATSDTPVGTGSASHQSGFGITGLGSQTVLAPGSFRSANSEPSMSVTQLLTSS